VGVGTRVGFPGFLKWHSHSKESMKGVEDKVKHFQQKIKKLILTLFLKNLFFDNAQHIRF
jgi:hypothetical protein